MVNKNDFIVFRVMQSLHIVNGHSGLWMFRSQPKGKKTVVFSNLLNMGKVINVDSNLTKITQLDAFVIYTKGLINQKALDEWNVEKGPRPKPLNTYKLSMRLLWMIQNMDQIVQIGQFECLGEPLLPSEKEITQDVLEKIMALAFPDYDPEQFKIYHMQKVWKWFLLILQFKNSLPVDEPIIDEPTVEAPLEIINTEEAQ